MAYSAKILADSRNPVGCRLTTFEITFPRIVLAEFNTHRMISRNSASSRAIPVEKQIAKIESDPFLPIYWGKNQKGMQASAELSASEIEEARSTWLIAKDDAVRAAKALLDRGVHKQITNRLLEPFMWHTVIASATEWQNFFNLRCHKDAQPEIRVIAEMMKSLYSTSTPRDLRHGVWHLPLVPDESEVMDLEAKDRLDARKVSAGRCARVSYLTHDGVRDPIADVELCDRLATSGHMSPLEHPAQSLDSHERHGNFSGFMQFRKHFAGEAIFREGEEG